jgi:hypothetical protein
MASKMEEELTSLVKDLAERLKGRSLDEAATKQSVVLNVLSKLGWNVFDAEEVQPEYSVGKGRVDFSLRIARDNKTFIEVKKPTEDLDSHEKQLLDYSFEQGVDLSILTNGTTWRFYLPLQKGPWEARRFYTIDVQQQDAAGVARRFVDFLSKDNVHSGRALENAETVYQDRQRENVLRQSLPKAWNKIISDPDELLVDLIGETAEKICGHKPSSELICEFLSQCKDTFVVREQAPIRREIGPREDRAPVSRSPLLGSHAREERSTYTGKTPLRFYFQGQPYTVHTWKDVLLKLCQLIAREKGPKFERVLELGGRKQYYFSLNPGHIRHPRRIDGTKVFAMTCLSAEGIVRLCHQVLDLFGYPTDLRIETHEPS